MARTLLVAALLLIVIGLGLVLFSDPALRLVTGASSSGFPSGGFSGADSSIFQTCRSLTNETVQQCLANNGVSFSGFGGSGLSGAGGFGSGAIGSTSSYASFGGIALIAIGAFLVLLQIFRMPRQNSSLNNYSQSNM